MESTLYVPNVSIPISSILTSFPICYSFSVRIFRTGVNLTEKSGKLALNAQRMFYVKIKIVSEVNGQVVVWLQSNYDHV